MAYNKKVLEHYENPRNVGTLDKKDENVGTGLVGAPACGDVMRLQIQVKHCYKVNTNQNNSYLVPFVENLEPKIGEGIARWKKQPEVITEVINGHYIQDAKFKTFGCGSAIASSSLVTEWVKGKDLEYAKNIKNQEIVKELSLPPVKVHCSVLAEDAIKAAVKDYEEKQKKELGELEKII